MDEVLNPDEDRVKRCIRDHWEAVKVLKSGTGEQGAFAFTCHQCDMEYVFNDVSNEFIVSLLQE